MSAGFTKGPWGLDEEGNVVSYDGATSRYGEVIIATPMGDTAEQAEANGRMLAESLNLYAELNEARLALKRIEQDPRTPVKMRDIAGARAFYAGTALAKARGEAS